MTKQKQDPVTKGARKDFWNALKTYVAGTEKPILKTFLLEDQETIRKYRFKTPTKLRKKFNELLKLKDARLVNTGLDEVNSQVWQNIVDLVENYVFAERRRKMFLWARCLFRSGDFLRYKHDLDNCLKEVTDKEEPNNEIERHLDIMSLKLMLNFSELGPKKKEALKLALSHVAVLMDEELSSIFEEELGSKVFAKVCESQKKINRYLPVADEERVRKGVRNFQRKLSTAYNINLDDQTTIESKVVSIMHLMKLNVKMWEDADEETEAMHNQYWTFIFVVLLQGTKVNVLPGETSSDSSKRMKRENNRFFNDDDYVSRDTNYQIGKKTDIIIKTAKSQAGNRVELLVCELKKGLDADVVAPLMPCTPEVAASSCGLSISKSTIAFVSDRKRKLVSVEDDNTRNGGMIGFKKKWESRRQLVVQTSINIRTNKCIDYFARRRGSLNAVRGLNGAGNIGEMFQLQPVEQDAFVAASLGQIILPINFKQLIDEQMEETMVNLFELQIHLIKMADMIDIAGDDSSLVELPQTFTTPPLKPATFISSSLPPLTPLYL